MPVVSVVVEVLVVLKVEVVVGGDVVADFSYVENIFFNLRYPISPAASTEIILLHFESKCT